MLSSRELHKLIVLSVAILLAGIMSYRINSRHKAMAQPSRLLFILILGFRNLAVASLLMLFVYQAAPELLNYRDSRVPLRVDCFRESPLLDCLKVTIATYRIDSLHMLSILVLISPIAFSLSVNLLHRLYRLTMRNDDKHIPEYLAGHPLPSLLFESSIDAQLVLELEMENGEILMGHRVDSPQLEGCHQTLPLFSMVLLARGYVCKGTRECIITSHHNGLVRVSFRADTIRSAIAHRPPNQLSTMKSGKESAVLD